MWKKSQKKIIKKLGENRKLPEKEIRMLKNRKLSSSQMIDIDFLFRIGIADDMLDIVCVPEYPKEKMGLFVRAAYDFTKGLLKEDTLREIINPDLSESQMEEMIKKQKDEMFWKTGGGNPEETKKRYESLMGKLTEEQRKEIERIRNFDNMIREDQLEIIARPEFTPKQIAFLSHGFDFKLPNEIMRKIADPAFDTFQIQQLVCGYRDSILGYVKKETMESLLDPSISAKKMDEKIMQDRNDYIRKIRGEER